MSFCYTLSEEEVKALHNFLMKVGYINYETDWLIVELVHKLDNYLATNVGRG